MPLFGTLDVASALADAPTMADLAPDTWTLPGVEVVQVSYEVDEAAALAVTPPACHPSIPPYATFSILSCPESPHGPFNLSMVRLIVRAGIRPRGLLLAAHTDNPAVARALASGWGYRVAEAEVGFSRRYGTIGGTVTIGAETALDVRLEDPEPVAGTDLELFDNLHLTRLTPNGGGGVEPEAVIVQVDPTYHYHSADRGRADLAVFRPDLLGVSGVDPVYRVVAVACRADLELTAPRFVMDPEVPAVQGTRRLSPA